MMPPQTMTTSALSMPEKSPELEDHLECSKRGDVPVIERWRHLDHVDADQLRARRGDAQEIQRLPGGQAAAGRDLRPRREGFVEGVAARQEG